MNTTLLPVIILAGGLATRLYPLTHSLPKSLIDINGEPFIAHQLRLLKSNGIQKVIICVGHLSEAIVDFVNDGSRFDLQVVYSFDGPTLLGTAGAIRLAISHLVEENFFVLYGDSYLPCCYQTVQEAFMQSHKNALMTIYHNKGAWDHSNVEFNNGILAYDKNKRNERMEYLDYGLGVFNKKAFTSISHEPLDLEQVYQQFLRQKQLAAFEVTERFYEVGSFLGIKALQNYLMTVQFFLHS